MEQVQSKETPRRRGKLSQRNLVFVGVLFGRKDILTWKAEATGILVLFGGRHQMPRAVFCIDQVFVAGFEPASRKFGCFCISIDAELCCDLGTSLKVPSPEKRDRKFAIHRS